MLQIYTTKIVTVVEKMTFSNGFFYIPTALNNILGNKSVELEFQKKYMKAVFIYTPFSSFLHIFVVFNWLNRNRNSDLNDL